MKRTAIFFFLLFAIASMAMPCFSQPIAMINNQLNGEPVVSTEEVVSQSGSATYYSATSTDLYIGVTVYGPNNGDTRGYAYGRWSHELSAPDGWTIKCIAAKNKNELTVLLDNGDGVMQLIFVTPTGSKTGNKISVRYGGLYGTPDNPGDWTKEIGDALYMLSNEGFYVSRDSGTTIQPDTAGLNDNVKDFALDTAQNVYAVGSQGLYVQDANGGAWSLSKSFTGISPKAIFIDRRNRVLVQASGMLYTSTDAGTTWSVDTAGVGRNLYLTLFADDAFGNLYASSGNLYASSGSYYTGVTNFIFRSSGGTAPWVRIDSGINTITNNVTAINSLSGDSILFAGTSFGVFASTDQGTTWSYGDTGITAGTYYGYVKTTGGLTFASTALGVYGEETNDTAWNKLYPQNGNMNGLSLYADNTGNLFVINLNPNLPTMPPIMKSTDNGVSWQLDSAGLSAIQGGLFYIDETGTQHIANTQGSGLWARTPGGAWTADTAGIPLNSSGIACMASDHAGYLYISGSFPGSIMRRSIAGSNWSVDSTGIPSHNFTIGLMASGDNGEIFTAEAENNYIMRRTGGTWQTLSNPHVLDSIWSTWVSAIYVDANGVLYAAFTTVGSLSSFGNGVYFTTNNGATWTYAGLDSIVVTALVSYGDTTYALTHGNGIYALTATGASAVNEKQAPQVNQGIVAESYPNPFTNTTTISYNVPFGYTSSVKIYDMLGRVASTSEESLGEGLHGYVWDAGALPQGAYYYTVVLKPTDNNAPLQTQTGMLLHIR